MSLRRGGPHHTFRSGNNRYTEVRYNNRWGRGGSESTCGGALCCTLVGFGLIIGSVILQFTTERNYINRWHDINTIKQNVIDITDSNTNKISSSTPIYMTDTLHLSSSPSYPYDSSTHVTYNGFVMHKTMEIYAWSQKKKTRKEQGYDNEDSRTVTTYDYIRKWTTKQERSNNFRYPEGHYNPNVNEFNSQNPDKYIWSSSIMFGKYRVSNDIRSVLIKDIPDYDWEDINQYVYDNYYVNKYEWSIKNGYIYLSYGEYGERYNEYEPNIGDVRVKWTGLDLDGHDATFLGSLSRANVLAGYYSENNEKYIYFRAGRINSIDSVINTFHGENTSNLYMFRAVSLVLMCIGFICTSSIVNYILSWIPIFGNLMGMALNLMACVVGFVFWLVFFAISYLVARPEIVIGFIVIVIAFLLFMQKGAVQKERNEGQRKQN